MDWFIFALLAPVIWGLDNLIDKYFLMKLIKDPFSYQILVSISDVLFLPVILLFVKPSLSYPWYIISIFLGMILEFAFVLYNKAIMIEETSRVVTMFYLNPIIVLPLAYVFIGELLSISKYVGVLLLVLSALLISYQKSKKKFRLSPALFYILILDLIWACHDVFSKYLFGFFDYFSFLFWSIIGAMTGAFIFLCFSKLRRNFINEVSKSDKKKVIFWRVFHAFSYYAAVLLFYFAISNGPISLVAAIPSVQPLFVLIYTIIVGSFMPKVFSEKNSKLTFFIKILSVFLIFIGTWLAVS